MALIKNSYELSVWSEKLNDEGIKEEIFGAIIGAHDMTALGRATNIKLVRNIKGTNTLTFQMPSKYFDSKIGEYVHNEFCDLLLNEVKIKFHYKEKWYEFYIKKIQEDKQFKSIMYTYTCEDSFIDELSRTGYEIEFADELNNSVAETGDFMEKILDTSIWDYTPQYNIGDFTEFNEQKFYKIPLSQFGGSIYGYKIDLSVTYEMFLDENGEPKDYLKQYLEKEGLDWDNSFENDEERLSYLESLITIYNIFNDDERIIELGDDLARERQIFWDNYYKDNGKELLSEDNKVTLTGDYIYVPITDLSMIMGSIYEDAYTAIEEPALYGKYGDQDKGYALQPTSKNPRELIQFIFLKDGDLYHIDEANVLSDNDFHYVIPIEEWNSLLENMLPKTGGLIYWRQAISTSVEKTNKYEIEEDGEYAYTTNARPDSSIIDDFTWYPIYCEGYLDSLNDTEVTMARKISITDRTEYNKNADMFVTVYNNKADEYVNKEKQTTLYSEKELANQVLDGKDYRVCSKINTRQILPELARNLVENGTNITDTNGWEARIQNKNNEPESGTGSYSQLLEINTQSTIVKAATESSASQQVTIDEYDLDGSIDDEAVSDYYLEILSPCLNKAFDFSLEGQIETDYALNFGIISQEKKIEKDKVYAIRLKTGTMETTAATFRYRNLENTDKITENIDSTVDVYKNTFKDYKSSIDIFSKENKDNSKAAAAKLGLSINDEINLFYEIIDNWPLESDSLRSEKISMVDELLAVILFGSDGKDVKIWGENKTVDNKDSLSYRTLEPIEGIINKHDKGKKNNYEKFASIALNAQETTNSLTQERSLSYTNSDVKYLKFYLYWHLSSTAYTISSYLSSTREQLTNSTVEDWIQTYILYDKQFNEKLNEDLNKIVIGQGAIDLQGNYKVQGTIDYNTGIINKNDEYYINFSDIFENTELVFIPSGNKEDSKKITSSNIYHIKNENGKWSWSTKQEEKSVKDEPFLLFKANKTITNPYIAIKVESGKLKIIFNSIQKVKYGENERNEVQINIKKDSYYYDDIPIKLVPVISTTCSDDFLELISYNEETGDFNSSLTTISKWDDSYLKSSYNSQIKNSSAKNPASFSTFLMNSNKDKTMPYLLFINNEFQGIIYLTKE